MSEEHTASFSRLLGLACTSPLQMEAVLSSEAVIKLHQNIRRHMREENTLGISLQLPNSPILTVRHFAR
jgi:hypothetical protein